MGRHSVAAPLLSRLQARHDGARQPGLGRRAHDWRRRRPHQDRRPREAAHLYAQPRLRSRRFQGHALDAAAVESAIAAADPAHRRPLDGLGFAPGRLSASGVGTRHNGSRSAGDEMQTAVISALALFLAVSPAAAATAYITNEKGNSITVVNLDKLVAVKTVEVGQRPRGIALSKDQKLLYVCLGDDDTIAILDAKTIARVGELPSGTDPEQLSLNPDGKLLFVANENDALLTAIDVGTKQAIIEIPVGVEPEGVAVSKDGETVVNTSETTSMAHFIDWRAKKVVANVLVPPRPRYADFSPD